MKRTARFVLPLGLAVVILYLLAGPGGPPGNHAAGPSPPPEKTDGTPLSALHPGLGLSFNFAKDVAVDTAGRVHAVWFDARHGPTQVYYRRSPDGGRSWEPELRITHTMTLSEHPAVAAWGENVYVAWHDMRHGAPQIYVRRSRDGGGSWEPEQRITTYLEGGAHPNLAASESGLHLVYFDHRYGATQIAYVRSEDGGSTWGAPVNVSESPAFAWTSTIAASGSHVYVAWVDTRDGNEEEYFRGSSDGGRTWGPVTRLTNDPSNSWAPSIGASGSEVHVVWFDQRDSPVQPRDVERAMDAMLALVGVAAEPPPTGVMVPHPHETAKQRATEKLRLIQGAAPGWAARGGDATALQTIMREFEAMARPSVEPAKVREIEAALNEAAGLAGASPEPLPPGAERDPDLFHKWAGEMGKKIVEAAGKSARKGGDRERLTRLMKSVEEKLGGASYLEKERKLDEAMTLLGLSYTPGPQTGIRQVFYLDAMGIRIEDKMKLLQKRAPAWVRAGGDKMTLDRLLAEFQRKADAITGGWEIYYKRSTDGGKTWGEDTRLTRAGGPSQRPSIAVSGGDLHVVWFDGRHGPTRIYGKHSTDDGRSWGPDTPLSAGTIPALLPSPAVAPNGLHVIWVEEENGTGRIRYRRLRP